MHTILTMLEGGDRRSIGRSNEVVALVLNNPKLFNVLIDGMTLDDPLIAMRCADAAEKVTVLHPEYLQPYKRMLIEELSKVEQKEVRWHVAAMLPRLPLTAKEQQHVTEILLAYTNDRSSIVKTLAMQALADIALSDEKLKQMVRLHIEELIVIGTPAMRARGKRLLSLLGDNHKPLREQAIMKTYIALFRGINVGGSSIATQKMIYNLLLPSVAQSKRAMALSPR